MRKQQNLQQVNNRWIDITWRPAMAWLYMITCAFDFLIAPIGWAILQASLGNPVTQWDPITLHGAGLYHLSMGAIIGVTAWGRSQEKIREILNSSPSDTKDDTETKE